MTSAFPVVHQPQGPAPLGALSAAPVLSGAGIAIQGLRKSFGPQTVLGGADTGGCAAGLDLAIRPGEFVSLVGPSGCGKSTLLRILAGLDHADAGTIRIGDRVVDGLHPSARGVAMVFQNYALYPQMSVADNIATPLMLERLSLWERLPLLGRLSLRRARRMQAIRQDVREVAAALQIEALLGRRPGQLSGGQRQRVALGRAMVRRPSVFLMDEPLSNLDAALRVHMRGELAALHQRLGATFVFVTHDQVEAMTLSDRVAMMVGGFIRQFGTPSELYDRPADLDVAQFIGSPPINLIPLATATGGGLTALGEALGLVQGLTDGASPATLGLRPEALRLVGPQDSATGWLCALERVENLGAEWLWHLRGPGPEAPALIARLSAVDHAALGLTPARGLAVRVLFDAAQAHLFGADGRRLEAGLVPARSAA